MRQVDLSNATSLSARLDSATSLSAPEGWKLQNVLRELREMLQGMNRWPGVEHVVLHAWHARGTLGLVGWCTMDTCAVTWWTK